MSESNTPKLNEVILIPITINDFKEMIRHIVRHEIQNLESTTNRQDPKPFRIKEALEYLGIGRTTLYFLVRDGKIKPFKPGKTLFFSKESLDRYLKGEPPEPYVEPSKYLTWRKRIKK